MLKVFADESGIHGDADVAALGGLMESREYWMSFCHQWRRILRNYDAKYFHYREFRPDANKKPGAPYYGWCLEKRRNFLYRLAMLIGKSAVPVGGGYATERNQKLGIAKDPFEETISSFYESTLKLLSMHWPNYVGRVHFIFDDSTNKEWKRAIDAMHLKYKQMHSRIGLISFGDDKKDPECLPLQAADFSTMHYRDAVRQAVKLEGKPLRDLRLIDFIIQKNLDVQLRGLPDAAMTRLLSDMQTHEKMQTALWREQGNPQTYLPLKHFPFRDYGYKK